MTASLAASPASSNSAAGDLLQVRDLVVTYRQVQGALSRRTVTINAVDGVTFSIARGDTLGLVGGTGSGKSTVAHVIMGMVPPTGGTVTIGRHDVGSVLGQERRELQRLVQVVLQDPYSSLNPRMKVRSIIAEPLDGYRVRRGRRAEREHVDRRVNELLGLVGLPPDKAALYPHQFSGGQRQRIAIARALASDPQLIVLDEPTSALDISIRAQILKLLKSLQDRLGITYLVISHDMVTVSYLASSVAVMYLGRIVEIAPRGALYTAPRHPYTVELLGSAPGVGAGVAAISQRPSTSTLAGSNPGGCRYANRCALRMRLGEPGRCLDEDPMLLAVGDGHRAACHFPDQVAGFAAAAAVTGDPTPEGS
jgi:oligopeptide/dipeptide ABC transporter ATP-binding protein